MSIQKKTLFGALTSAILLSSSFAAQAEATTYLSKRAMKKIASAGMVQIANGLSLYAATPRIILSANESLLDRAFSANRTSPDTNTKQMWAHVGGTRLKSSSIAQARLKAFGALDANQPIDTNVTSLQLGRTVMAGDSTRIDLFGGLAGHASGTGASRKRAFETTGGVIALGGVVDHLHASGLRARLGTQLTGGSAEFKIRDKDLKSMTKKNQTFATVGLGLKGELSKDVELGNQFVLTPALGFGHQMAWINPKDSKKASSIEHAISMTASTRLAYAFNGANGRAANAWLEPSYVNHIKRTASVKGAGIDFSSRGPRQQVGLAVGTNLPVGKQGELSASYGYSRALGNVKHKQATLDLGYSHRF